MGRVAVDVLELAENANTFTPLGSGEQRLQDPRYVVYLGRSRQPWSTVVQRLRLEPGSVEETVREVRDLLRRFERPSSTWEIGSSATPADLGERLERLGLVPVSDPDVLGMVLSEPPPPAPAEVEVRPVSSADDYRAALEVMHEAFEVPEEAAAAELAAAGETFARWDTSPDSLLYLAWLNGEPVAAARATFTEHGAVLNAGSTRRDTRGRGAYRALVAARWDEAVKRGTPALITQAGAQSAPILKRLGFREVARIRILLDEAS